MAKPASGIMMTSDLKYFATFTAGMAAFWVSGHAAQLLPAIKPQALSVVAALAVTAGVYGLGMLLVSWLVFRKVGRGLIISTLTAVVLGIASAQIIVRLAASHVHTKNDLAALTFALYLCYGLIYALALAVGRRFAR